MKTINAGIYNIALWDRKNYTNNWEGMGSNSWMRKKSYCNNKRDCERHSERGSDGEIMERQIEA